MKIEVQYYAVFRESAGLSTEAIDTGSTTAGQLYEQLRTRHGFALEADSVRVAVNEAFADWDAPLAEGDRVVFIPPVAGG